MCNGFLAGVLVFASFTPIAAFAQTSGEAGGTPDLSSFESLPGRVASGQTVFVEDATRHKTRGTLVRLSDASITLRVDGEEKEFSRGEIRTLARKGDSVRNGATIGGLIMGGLGVMTALSLGDYEDVGVGGGLAMIGVTAAMGAGAGALIDYAIRGKTTVYRANAATITASPLMVHKGGGVRVALRF